jgi:23S rRNA (cytosine1962-C5)-methyltransferase
MIPTLRLKPGRDASVRAGHPWIFSRALEQEGTELEPGQLVHIVDASDRSVGTGYVNPLTNIRVRLLSQDAKATIDAAFFAARFTQLDAWKRTKLPPNTTISMRDYEHKTSHHQPKYTTYDKT